MRWRRVDPVQHIGALMMTGPAAPDRLAAALARKAALFRTLPDEQGDDWAVLFATGEGLLPRIEGAVPLHEAAPGCWLPVGIVVDAPDHVLPSLWKMLADSHDVRPPFVVLPDLNDPGAGEVYLIRDPAPLDERTELAS